MSVKENVGVVLEVFGAIERRDQGRLLDLFSSEVEFHWAPSLPYSRDLRGLQSEGPIWAETWVPLQSTDAERRMDPRVVAASEKEVVVLWRQRGVTAAGDRFDGAVLGLYEVREGKLARAQMFYFGGQLLSEPQGCGLSQRHAHVRANPPRGCRGSARVVVGERLHAMRAPSGSVPPLVVALGGVLRTAPVAGHYPEWVIDRETVDNVRDLAVGEGCDGLGVVPPKRMPRRRHSYAAARACHERARTAAMRPARSVRRRP